MVRTFENIKEGLKSGELTLESLVQEYLIKIDQSKHLNIYVEVWAEEAIEQAKTLDQKRKNHPNSCGQLHGVVMSIKDVLCYAGHKVTAASKMLVGFESQITATVVQRAIDQDAIIIGRTNCDEFAMGSTNENSYYGPTINGHGENLVPGGSSGAAAVSVQMDTCLLALGSDTGGSVRQPAAFCGVYGMKPTYGWLSRYGLIAYASSFDQIGFLTQDPAMISVAMSALGGRDTMDATSVDITPYISEQNDSAKPLKIAYFDGLLEQDGISEQHKAVLKNKIAAHRKAGHQVDPVAFDMMDALVPCYYVLTTAEASSNLNRYDGLRYGHSSDDSSSIDQLIIDSRSSGFGLEIKRRIIMGTYVMSVGYFDAYFAQAQRVRRIIKEKVDKILDEYDLIIMPTTPGGPWPIGDSDRDPLTIYLSDVYTVLANICALPAISIPHEHENHKVGIQYMSARHRDFFLIKNAPSL